MLRLLWTDVVALRNAIVRGDGRRGAIASLVSLAFLLAVSWLFGQVLAHTPELWDLQNDLDTDRARAAAGAMLMPGLIMALWFAFGGGPRILFENPRLPLLMSAPLPALAVPMSLWLRFALLVTVWCAALSAPALSSLGEALAIDYPIWALLAAAAALCLPTVAFVFAVQILLQRFFAGRVTRAILTVCTTLLSLAFSVVLIAGGLAQRDAAMEVFAAIRGRAVFPWILEGPARFLGDTATGQPDAGSFLALTAGPAAATLAFGAVALLHRRAWELSREAPEPIFRRRRGRDWPTQPSRVVFSKELAQLTHQPAQLLGILFSTLIVVVLGASRFLGEHVVDDPRLPTEVRAVFILLGLWLFAQLTVAPGCMVRLVTTDAAQWVLYRTAPATSTQILRGKLRVVLLLQAWPALVAALVGRFQLHVGWLEIGAFLLVVPAGLLWTTGLTAFVGTIPGLMQPREDRNHVAILTAVALLLFLLQVTVIPALIAWNLLAERFAGTGEGLLAPLSKSIAVIAVVLGTWILGALLGALSLGVAAWQFSRLTRPER